MFEGKGPTVKTGTETNRGIGRINTDNAHGTFIISIGGDDDIDVLDNLLEGQEQFFLFKLEFQEGTVHFVHEKDRLDTFSNGLPKYSLSLHADTWKKESQLII